MERRELLGTVATVGAAVVAGCSNAPSPGGGGDGGANDGGDGGGDGDGGENTSDGGDGGGEESTTDGENDADLYVAQAVSTLNAVALRLNKVQDELDAPEEVELDQEKLLSGIEEARGNLDAASETATDEQAAQIETLRHLATVLEELTRVVGILLAVDPDAVAENAKTAVDAENYDEALSVVRDANSKATTAQERTTTAEDALTGVDPDRLAAVDGVEYAKVESAVTETATLVDGFETLTGGYEASILGAQDLESGRSHSEAEEFDAAKADFENARAHFETANETFATADADADGDLSARIDVASCQTTHLEQAAIAFEEGATDASDGNLVEARQHRENGEEQMEQVDACGGK
ncbi:hypothetical protein G9C85_08960 [Halorubellus sp. JP-L1]|uniref:hypothetical protein n=1 Tax=Halorubellus sp. JP-L1 TaxID=2715753 RepID=UPI00140E8738|nr:hypothetical protein [Halorubellus sp. JP-L1]NHN41759.1 hypothetical protein [Halorubellus sp. JP-L1]